MAKIYDILNNLSNVEQTIFSMYWGINRNVPMSEQDIADALNLSFLKIHTLNQGISKKIKAANLI